MGFKFTEQLGKSNYSLNGKTVWNLFQLLTYQGNNNTIAGLRYLG
ncbi:hypothetical protein NSP_40150 [Nodularia spumigena CCY9414]|nr:hypothetical protein NSP_40150 [Nodularia spumigena CCY9414]